ELLLCKLEQRHLHVWVVHEPGVREAQSAVPISIQCTKLPFKFPGEPQVVLRSKTDPLALSPRNSCIESATDTLVILVVITHTFAPGRSICDRSLHHASSIVCRAIIDDDDLEGGICLR